MMGQKRTGHGGNAKREGEGAGGIEPRPASLSIAHCIAAAATMDRGSLAHVN